MRYNPEKTNRRLEGVPMKDRVFIYNAAIIIEFLNQTFMPTAYFLKPEEIANIGPAEDLKPKHMRNPADLEEKKLTVGDLYDYYKLFRQHKDYTAPIESRYKFSVIMKKLGLMKNGWKFNVKRVGRAQLIYLAPAELRVRVDSEIRKAWPPGAINLSGAQVEIEPKDTLEPPEMIEVKPEQFKDATFEVDVKVDPAPPIEPDGF